MGYKVKVQKIERPKNKTYYVNFPGTFADAINLEKGEELEWFIEDRNCFVLRRVKSVATFITKTEASATDEHAPKKPRTK
ncbi:MAG: hypothetical protein WCK70_15690 [Chloroflexales bacterium]|jgi:hypothetical protein